VTKRERGRLLTTINTFSQESLHISIKVFARDAMTCVRLLLLDYIARNKIKKKRLVTVLERKRIFVWYNHFYELTYVRKERKDADLDSRQADTCSFTSVRLKKCWQFSFWSNQYLCERSKHQHVVCSFSFSDQTKTQIINHAAHLH
jgi:hypothetical protein